MIYEVKSALNKQIPITDTQWEHVKQHHPELHTEINKVQETLAFPDFVVQSISDETYHYVRHYKKTPVTTKFLLLVVKHLNGDGFLITAFFVNKIKKQGKEVVYGKANFNRI